MKSPSWIIASAVLVSVLFWLLWPRAIQHVRSLAQESEPATVKAPDSVRPPSLSNPSLHSEAAKIYANNPSNIVDSMRKVYDEKNVPLDFYGQTTDQDGNPLSNVDIRVRVRHWDVATYGNSIPLDRKSDSSGMFDIHDVTGDAFDLESMSKEGYELEPTHRGWGPTGGVPGNPVIFRLWRKDIKEPLITGQKSFSIEPNGTSYIVDLTNGTISQSAGENGDLKLRINMPPSIAGKSPTWSCEFRMVNGGLAEETDTSSAMYLAPTSGYTNLFSFAISPTNPWTRQSGTLRFYLRLKEGKEYGRVSIDMAMWARKPNVLRVEYAINPTGSHILR